MRQARLEAGWVQCMRHHAGRVLVGFCETWGRIAIQLGQFQRLLIRGLIRPLVGRRQGDYLAQHGRPSAATGPRQGGGPEGGPPWFSGSLYVVHYGPRKATRATIDASSFERQGGRSRVPWSSPRSRYSRMGGARGLKDADPYQHPLPAPATG